MVSNFNSGQAIKTFVVGPVNFSDGPKEMNKEVYLRPGLPGLKSMFQVTLDENKWLDKTNICCEIQHYKQFNLNDVC